MPKISSYPSVTPTGSDLVLIADASAAGNPTKTATVSSINALNNDETLQDVLDANNTAIEDINLTGNIALTGNLTGAGSITRTGNVVLTGDLTGTGDITRTGDMALTGDLTGAGNITRTGNITLTGAQTISTTLGVTGTTTLGVLSLSSISGGWTNAGNTIADLGTVTTIDINGGTIDGTVIGNSNPADGTFGALVATTFNGQIGDVTPAIGAFTTIEATDLTIGGTMTATTSNLGILGSTVNCGGQLLQDGDIDQCTINDTVIGGSTPAAGSFTTITGSGNLTIDTDTLFVDATTNKVGIGTVVPSEPLHIVNSSNGGIEIENTSGAPSLTFDMPGNEEARIIFKEDTMLRSSIVWDSQAPGINNLIFKGKGTNTEVMRIAAAGNVGIGTPTPEPCSILELDSTTQGFRLPRMTTTQRNAIGSPEIGLMIYNITTTTVDVYTGSWQALSF